VHLVYFCDMNHKVDEFSVEFRQTAQMLAIELGCRDCDGRMLITSEDGRDWDREIVGFDLACDVLHHQRFTSNPLVRDLYPF